jgi:type II secretory pathway component PulC
MKDRKIIDQLHLLQSFQADTATLRLIRKKIPLQVVDSKRFSFKKWLTVTLFIPVIAFAVVVIFFLVMISIFPYVIDNAVVNAKIAFAPNHYEKAKIALANVNDQLPVASDTNKIKLLSQALALANTEMSGLQLVGEKGKYTSYQCEELYESYHTDLRKVENAFDSKRSNEVNLLVSQSEQYDKQAAVKLKNYNKKIWINNEN